MNQALARAMMPALLALVGCSAFAAEPAPEASADLVAATASKIPCSSCHTDLTKNYVMSRHGVTDDTRTPGTNCMTCHGETLRHMSNPVKEKPQFTFKRDAQGFMDEESRAAADKVCTSCHNTTDQKHWAGSTHQRNGVACVSCHSNHKADIAVEKKTSTALCLSCHSDQKSNLFKTSTHPLLDGQMNCVSCHNPHGTKSGGEFLMKKETVNDTCFSCHPGKRGPFAYPHQPVTENCGNCHNPHGSNKGSMLKMRDDMLCESCHQKHHPEVARRVGCQSCHNQVHGSNTLSGTGLTN